MRRCLRRPASCRRDAGALLNQGELDPKLEYDDPIKRESIVARVGPIHTSGNLALALTCRKIDRKDAVRL